MEKIDEVVNKVSDTEIEIVKEIPEQVIPARTEITRVSLTALKEKLAILNAEIANLESMRDIPQKQIDELNAKIDSMKEERTKLESLIEQAVAQGAKDDKDVQADLPV